VASSSQRAERRDDAVGYNTLTAAAKPLLRGHIGIAPNRPVLFLLRRMCGVSAARRIDGTDPRVMCTTRRALLQSTEGAEGDSRPSHPQGSASGTTGTS
jgi:hypothetical protein